MLSLLWKALAVANILDVSCKSDWVDIITPWWCGSWMTPLSPSHHSVKLSLISQFEYAVYIAAESCLDIPNCKISMIVVIGTMVGDFLLIFLGPQSSSILICKNTVLQKQLQFIHTNFTITQNHVNNIKGLASPKLSSIGLLDDISLYHPPTRCLRWAMPTLQKEANCSCSAQSNTKTKVPWLVRHHPQG